MPQPIESVGAVLFWDKAFLISGESRVDVLLDKKDRVRHLSMGYESSLIFQDKTIYEGFEVGGYDFCDNRVEGIAQGYGAKYSKGGRTVLLGDEGEES